jgi:hydrogenase nickel incorporation protein HypB
MKSRQIKVYKDLMGENEKWAAETRVLLEGGNITMLNLIGSPGSGKTALLESLAQSDAGAFRFAVLEGDVETTHDAERLHRHNVIVSQLLSGGACHLEAKLVHRALRDLPLDDLDVVFVENVGNLVCPAEFDIGEYAKVAVLSVTEGEDKPVKYPLLFTEAKAVVLTKLDLLPHLRFNIDECVSYIRQINAGVPVMRVSSQTGEGIGEWCAWVGEAVKARSSR